MLAGRSSAASLIGKVAKTLLLPSVVFLIWALLHEQNSLDGSCIPPLLFTGMLFGWLGDLCLLGKSKKMLMLGGAAFGIGHMIYISMGFVLLAEQPGNAHTRFLFWTSFAIFFTVFVLAGRAHIQRLLRQDAVRARWQEMRVGFVAYALLLCGTASMFSALAISLGIPQLWFAAAGGVMFLLSDSLLAVQELQGHSYIRHGVLMALYTAGQLCIGLDVALTLV